MNVVANTLTKPIDAIRDAMRDDTRATPDRHDTYLPDLEEHGHTRTA